MGYAVSVTGTFNSATKKAVKKFQKKTGVSQTGNVAKKTREKFKAKGYAIGSKKIDKDQLAWIDELGPELQIVPNGQGRLEYLKKGTGVVPADLTANLMEWGKLDPTSMIDQNRPSIAASPSVHATEVNLNIQYGDMLKIENFKGDNPDEIAKIVAKQFEKHTKDLNSALRRYVR
jgi:peptidoglycan hydrolase-like protein with peptidoglycan-binding domain